MDPKALDDDGLSHSSSTPQRQIHVLLTLNDNERSFGMSLAQKISSLGVSSDLDRAPEGYVVRCINDVAMGDMPVAHVASHFRKVRQAKLTLDVVESVGTCSPADGKVTLPSAFNCADAQRRTVSSMENAVSLSGRAIAAPGSALAVSNTAAPKQPISRLEAKAAAKSVKLLPRVQVASPVCVNGASTGVKKDAEALSSADGKTAKNTSDTNVKKKCTEAVAPSLQSEQVTEAETSSSKVATVTTENDAKERTNRPRSSEAKVDTVTAAQLNISPGTSSTVPTKKKSTPALVAAPAPSSEKTTTAPVVKAAVPDQVKPTPVSLPEPAFVGDRSDASSPKCVASRSNMKVETSPPVSSMIVTETVETPSKSSKKRSRSRPASGSTEIVSNKGKNKAKKLLKQLKESNGDSTMVDEDAVNSCVTSESELDESLPRKACRPVSGRRRGAAERTRHSLTIDRLVDMGFLKEDAEASVQEIGDDPDACMVWIISKIEERQFNEDLNRASIQSEQSKHDEEKRVQKLEKEKLARAEKFIAVFPTSYMVSSDSEALHFKKLVQSTIDQVTGKSELRQVLSELMKLESKTIRWYKQASRSYLLQVAQRLDAVLVRHDVLTCCARASLPDETTSSSAGCVFLRAIQDEVKMLTTALFEMPRNQGGVPPVFLECDETTKFDLEDDGFEVVEAEQGDTR